MSLKSRMDNRSLEEFKKDISLDTAIQEVWSVITQQFFRDTTKDNFCEKIDNGVDNSGNIIFGDLKNDNVDYIYLLLRRRMPVEIKTIPESCKNFMTFKASSLQSCVKQKAYVIVPKKDCFYMYPPNMCKYLLHKYPKKIYERFSPNDLAVRIYIQDIEKFVKDGSIMKKIWTPNCLKLIEDNWDLLSRKKQKWS